MGIRSQNNPIAAYLDVFSGTGVDAGSGGDSFGTPQGITATGGSINDYIDGSEVYRAHIFTSSGSFDVTDTASNFGNNIEYLVVAGGGGSGFGGGGAGGVKSNSPEMPQPRRGSAFSVSASPGSYTVQIGAGGISGQAQRGQTGSNSVFGPITANGGGWGGGGPSGSPENTGAGGSGGSGGGGGHNPGGGGTGDAGGTTPDPNQGFAGGLGYQSGPKYGGGGGGGAGGAGGNATGSGPDTITGGNGGVGLKFSIGGPSDNEIEVLDQLLEDGLLAVVLDHILLKVVVKVDLLLEVEILRFHHPQQCVRSWWTQHWWRWWRRKWH